MKKKELQKYIGKEFYSKFFGQHFIVLSIENDDNWKLRLNSGETHNANTKLSYFIN